MPARSAPVVRLGAIDTDSIAPTVFALVRHGASERPDRAAALRAVVLLRFAEDYPAVRLTFAGTEIEVRDHRPDTDGPADLAIIGRMGDVNALLTAPLAGGMPSPAAATGRAALRRLADGRVRLDGPLGLGRQVLRVLSVTGLHPTPEDLE